MDAYSECYSKEELSNLKDITIQVTLEFLKNIADESGSSHLVSSIGLLQNCPTVKAVPFGFFGASWSLPLKIMILDPTGVYFNIF